MSKIFTPLNQIKLTNVSVVRLKKNGKRFEIACYKNKVMEWRNGVEKDLDNVIQIHEIFSNVSKGLAANKNELVKAFKTDDEAAIILEILARGDLQVGEKERSSQLNQLNNEVATLVSSMCINPETSRPYPVSTIMKVISDLQISFHSSKSAKQQALDAIKLMKEKATIPIKRAQMRVRVVVPIKDAKRLKDQIMNEFDEKDLDDWNADEWELIGTVDPGAIKRVSDLLQAETRGKGRLEVLNVKVVKEGQESL